VPRKEDLKQVDAVARRYGMNAQQRRDFGLFIEDEKASGGHGTKNERGDFTFEELCRLAQEILQLTDEGE
jgi:hypothetical protein